MNHLLENAVAAHGGSDRWNQVKSITVDASITGAICAWSCARAVCLILGCGLGSAGHPARSGPGDSLT